MTLISLTHRSMRRSTTEFYNQPSPTPSADQERQRSWVYGRYLYLKICRRVKAWSTPTALTGGYSENTCLTHECSKRRMDYSHYRQSYGVDGPGKNKVFISWDIHLVSSNPTVTHRLGGKRACWHMVHYQVDLSRIYRFCHSTSQRPVRWRFWELWGTFPSA